MKPFAAAGEARSLLATRCPVAGQVAVNTRGN